MLEKILEQVRAWFAMHGNPDVGDMKTIAGVSRKHAISLLEYMDGIRLTYRAGNQRPLRK